MWLLVDDERTLDTHVIARTYEAGLRLLQALEWDVLCLDHDLGVGPTGYDLLVWSLEARRTPRRVQLVTANPVGRQNMRAALLAAGYQSRNGVDYCVLDVKGSPD